MRVASDLTDRERLALAFDRLRSDGWFAPITWGAQMCCSSCGWLEIVRQTGDGEEEEWDWESHKTIWWHADADTHAFVQDGDTYPMVDEMGPHLREADDPEQWLEDNKEVLRQMSLLVRTADDRYQYLHDDLYVHWSGGDVAQRAAVSVMREVGLFVSEPDSEESCIVVHPAAGQRVVRVARRDDSAIEIRLTDNKEAHGLVLPIEDAILLVDRLERAIRHSMREMDETHQAVILHNVETLSDKRRKTVRRWRRKKQ